jgi:death-on-curing protein
MTGPRRVGKTALLLLHAESLAEHGGLEGMRDEGLLDSALARPLNVQAYEGIDDPTRLAAAYALGIARNHPFADGNKHAAFLALGLVLGLNGWRLTAAWVFRSTRKRRRRSSCLPAQAATIFMARRQFGPSLRAPYA